MMAAGRVLVADDDGAIRSSVSEILRRSGFAVSQAEDGDEALGKLASEEVDAAVIDVRMPGRDGISVVEQMIPGPPPPGVVLVTAYDVDGETRIRLGSRVRNILRKPIPPATLIAAVRDAVDAARQARSDPSPPL